MITGFHDHHLDLTQVNQAGVIMIPKIDAPKTVTDYRPISIINVIPKFISKILANQLRKVLPDLISPQQTAFISGRQISDNFVATQEVLQHTSFMKNSAIFARIDLAKAFDTIEWEFLIKVLIARGFPRRWITWIETLLKTTTSRVIINGEASEFITHKKG